MEKISKVKLNDRQVYYLSARREKDWYDQLPDSNWVAFIVVDSDDVNYMIDLAVKCMDKNVGYVCTAGMFCEKLHDIFNEEITARGIEIEKKTGKEYDHEGSPMTTEHSNFGEGLWFAMINTYDGDKEFDKLVCLDSTERGVRQYVGSLIEKINGSWFPSDAEIEEPLYDK